VIQTRTFAEFLPTAKILSAHRIGFFKMLEKPDGGK